MARAWMEAGNPPPLTMTEREWRASPDIFPIEYTDVLDQHHVLHGAWLALLQRDPKSGRRLSGHRLAGRLAVGGNSEGGSALTGGLTSPG